MKLAIVMYTSGSVSGGAAKHLRMIMPLLLEHPAIAELRLFMPRGALADVPADWPLSEWAPQRGGAMRDLRAQLAAFAPDVVFIPSARWFPTPGARTVVMVRNMEPLRTPFAGNRPAERVRNVGRYLAAAAACVRADRVIAVSDHVRDWLLDHWHLNPARIGTVPHGVGAPPAAVRPARLPDLAGARFVFSAGSIRPARGLADLVGALRHPAFPPDLHFVFAGKVDAGAEAHHSELCRQIEAAGLQGRVHWLGQSTPAELSWCFGNASLFAMTSRAEACPNVVLETLSHGCVAVSCDTPPMPEFFADAARYYRSGDPAALAMQIAQTSALEPVEQQGLRERALLRAAQFTWENCAERTVAELQAAATG